MPDVCRRRSKLLPRAKAAAARVGCAPIVGETIGRLTHDRVRNNSLVFDTGDPLISAHVKAKLFWNLYEHAEIGMVRRWLQHPSVVVELGSSLGICASHVATAMSPGARLICVEADERLLPVIQKALRTHARHLATSVVHAVVTSPSVAAVGRTSFAISPVTTASRVGVGRPSGKDVVVEAPAMTLSAILREHAIEEYSLVADIEGAEAEILLHDPQSLRLCRQAVVEFHDAVVQGRTIAAAEVAEAMAALGFRTIDGRGNVAFMRREG